MKKPREIAMTPATHVPSDAGMGLLEVVIAMSLLLVLMLGLLPIGLLAVATTENEGHLAARASEYSQDKMEQLLSLAYTDENSNTCGITSAPAGGTGLKPGGSATALGTPAALYVDYLDVNGNFLPASGTCGNPTAPPDGWFYRRTWQITANAPVANMKQVTVTTSVARGYIYGRRPQATLTALKSFPF